MPHKTKKKFIDKKKAVTFQLVHRSQKDPLAADEDAPQRVLVPIDDVVTESEVFQETTYEREQRISMQRTYGIGFDDDYDYMQHLREPEKQTAILVPKSGRVCEPLEDGFMDEEHMTELLKDGGQSAVIRMPSVVFASKEEEEVGMLHRAIPPVGPQVEWDPDVVAALDEDFDLDDPDNLIEDDFILQASEGAEQGCNEFDENGEEEFSGSDLGSLMSDEDEFQEEETRSRFTQYSMSSSVLPRSEHLTLLDDQFEKFYETYDDENIGDLGQVEIDGAVPVHDVCQQEAVKMLLGIKDLDTENFKIEEEKSSMEGYVDSYDSTECCPTEEDQNECCDDLVELVKEMPKEKWDCESILSTYSNIYNHPKVIEVPLKPIKLSKKTGIPLDTLPTRGLTEKQLRNLDLQNEETWNQEHKVSESSDVTSVVSNFRKKNETKEEKACRKQAVKDARRERRVEKKATKTAFRREKSRQHKEYLNLQQNLSGIRIS